MKERSVNILKNLPLSRKMLVIYISCVIVPVMILSIFYYHISKTGIQRQEKKDLESAVVKSENSIQSIMDKTVLVRELIAYDSEVADILAIDGESEKSLIKASNSLDSKALPYKTNDFLESLRIYSKNPYLYSSTVHRRMSELEKTGWIEKYGLKSGSYCVFLNRDDETERTNLIMLSMLRKTRASDTNILRLDLPTAVLSRELETNAIKGSIYLVDENNRIIALAAPENGSAEHSEGETLGLDAPDTIYRELDFPRGYKVVSRYFPNRSEYVLEAQTMQFILVVLFILLLSTVIIYLITKSLTNKMNKLTACTVKIQRGIFEPVDESDAGEDEIGVLFHGVNDAVCKINSLINEVYAERIKNAEAEKARYQMELSALQARVDPHFMFNVFEVMRMKVVKRGDKELAAVIKEISKIFRMLISWNSDTVTLDEEMKFVDAFLKIQPYSIDDEEMDISVSVSDNARRCLLPKMSVQVFVENAFLHGLENISDNRCFSLDAHIEDEKLVITVCDNGCGIDEETLAKIRNGEPIESKKGGMGIKNVLSRLKYYFEDDYTFRITSVPYTETKIKLILPIKYE